MLIEELQQFKDDEMKRNEMNDEEKIKRNNKSKLSKRVMSKCQTKKRLLEKQNKLDKVHMNKRQQVWMLYMSQIYLMIEVFNWFYFSTIY